MEVTVGLALLGLLTGVGKAVINDRFVRFSRRRTLQRLVLDSIVWGATAQEDNLRQRGWLVPGGTKDERIVVVDPTAMREPWPAFAASWQASSGSPDEGLSLLRSVVTISGFRGSEEEHRQALRGVLQAARTEFWTRLPDADPAFRQYLLMMLPGLIDRINELRSNHEALAALIDLRQQEVLSGIADLREVLQEKSLPGAAVGPRLYMGRFPMVGVDSSGKELPFAGREGELELLDSAWRDGSVHLLALYGDAGVGKSAVVDRWFRQMRLDGFRGATNVIRWSFYQQGMEASTASADQFLSEALDLLGAQCPSDSTAERKGRELARQIRAARTLLILDGLEPLQQPPGYMDAGKIRDPGIRALLEEITGAMNGLCIVTSRVPVLAPRLSPDEGPNQYRDLGLLSEDQALRLLRLSHITGSSRELHDLASAYRCHALSLVLVAEYLREWHGGSARGYVDVPLLSRGTRLSDWAFRAIGAYAIALQEHGLQVEREALRMVGLFDRPATQDCVDHLRRQPAIPGVTNRAAHATNEEWLGALGRLRKWRLLSPGLGERDGSMDAHPLVREFAAELLKEESPDGARRAHARAYRYFSAHSPPFPESASGMALLYQAMRHGCFAGGYRSAYRKIYLPRVSRISEETGRPTAYDTRRLGLFGDLLSALQGFFEVPWTKLHRGLQLDAREEILNSTGHCLLSLGRIAEATQALQGAVDVAKKRRHWQSTEVMLYNLSFCYVARGDLDAALRVVEEEMEYGALCEPDTFSYRRCHASMAGLLYRRGCLAPALEAFKEAERLEPSRDGLYATPGADYCWLLLDLGEVAEVVRRAERSIPREEGRGLKREVGVSNAILGLALQRLLDQADGQEAKEQLLQRARRCLDVAVDRLVSYGRSDMVPIGFLARAAFLRDAGEPDQAHTDLAQALDHATNVGLPLHETDCQLLRGHLALDREPADIAAAGDAASRARSLIADAGYHLRDADLAILEGRILAYRRQYDDAKARLSEAVGMAQRGGVAYRSAVERANCCLARL